MVEKIYSREVFQFNLKLELLTYLVNVPIVGFFIILANQLYGQKFFSILISMSVAIVFTLVITPLVRTIVLNKIIYAVPTPENKLMFFKLPFKVGFVIIFQWIIGFSIVGITFSIIDTLTKEIAFSFFYCILIQTINNFASHALATDRFVAKIIQKKEWRDIEVQHSESDVLLKGRVLLTNFGFCLLPIGTFFYLFINGSIANPNDPYKEILVSGIFFQTLLVVLFGSFGITNSILKNINNLKTGLEEFKNGNLKSNISLIDNEEIGLMIEDFKKVQGKISETLQKTSQTIQKLNQVSVNLTSNSDFIYKQSTNLNQLSDSMSISMEQFYGSIENSRKISLEQNELTKKSFESLNFLNQEIMNNSKSVDDSQKISKRSKEISAEGSRLGKELQDSINEIRVESDQIKEYSNVISDISEKVGLLSLNASIEAARAGEFGRGFAVVASEISKLGENTTENSTLIDKKIKELSKSVLKGVEKISILAEKFKQIEDASNSTNESLISIAKNLNSELDLKDKVKLNIETLLQNSEIIKTSGEEQKKVIDLFLKDTSQVKQASENLYNSIDDLQKISNELKLDADELVLQIQFFKF